MVEERVEERVEGLPAGAEGAVPVDPAGEGCGGGEGEGRGVGGVYRTKSLPSLEWRYATKSTTSIGRQVVAMRATCPMSPHSSSFNALPTPISLLIHTLDFDGIRSVSSPLCVSLFELSFELCPSRAAAAWLYIVVS